MKPSAFQYHRAQSARHACELLATLPDARLIAGGQSLVPMMAMRYVSSAHLVDIGAVAELKSITETPEGIRVGAAVTQSTLLSDPLVARRLPLVPEALRHVGHLQTRNKGTFVGSLCHFDPASEQPLMAALHDAELEVQSHGGGRRLRFDEFARGHMSTALAPHEIVVAVTLKPWPATAGVAFEEFARRRGDFALAGCGVLLEASPDGRVTRLAVGLCGVAGKPVRLVALERKAAAGASIDAIAQRLRDEIAALPIADDGMASAAYRRRLATSLAERALARAYRQRQQESAA